MQPDQPQNSPAKWLKYAKSDLAIAELPLPAGANYETLCFHAQQAAEKSIKAILLSRAIAFPYTHSIQILIDLLPADLVDPQLKPLMALTPYAIMTR